MGPPLYFALTIDDLIAFNRHVLRASPIARKQLRRAQYAMVPSLVILILITSSFQWYDGSLFAVAIVIMAAYGLAILFLGTITELRIPGRIRRQVADGVHPPLTPSRVWIDPHGGVVDESLNSTTWYSPSAIENIEETPDHVFVYVGPAKALIIPRRADDAAVRAFVQALTWLRADRAPVSTDWR